RRSGCRLRLSHRRATGRGEGEGDTPASEVAAHRPLRGGHRQVAAIARERPGLPDRVAVARRPQRAPRRLVRAPVTARAFTAMLWLAAALVVSFLMLPVIAIFARVPLGDLVDQLSSDVVRDALRVTLKTNLIALLFVLGLGTPTAYLLATR